MSISTAVYVVTSIDVDKRLLLLQYTAPTSKRANEAIAKYAVHLVIANELHSRFDEVLLITDKDERSITRPEEAADIEEALMEAVARIHYQYIASSDIFVLNEIGHRSSRRHFSSAWKKQLPTSMQSLLSAMEEHKEEILGVVLGGLLSVLLNMLQRRSR